MKTMILQNTVCRLRRTGVMRSLASLFVVISLVAGCSPFKPTPRLEVLPLPQAFVMYSEEPPAPDKWWEAFGNTQLNALVEDALAANFDILAAWGSLRQMRATAIQAGADKYPTLDATGSYSHTRQGQDGTNGGRSITTTEAHSLGVSAGYELDLWGRIAAGATAGELDAESSREDLSTASMTVAGEVVSKWVQIEAQRQKKRILTEQIQANQTYLELIELRYRNSLATSLDVYQQRENVARVKAELPPVESEEQVLLHELALLVGRPAGSVEIADAALPVLSPLPGLGLPTDLLANRPDIRSAGLKLHSADWTVAAAKANRLPSVNLTGDAAYSGTQLATLFNNWMFALAGSVIGPILDGGARKAEVEKSYGVMDERLAEYKTAVYTAFKEVQDALVREKWQKEYIAARQAQLEAAQVNLDEAITRYSQGLDDYLPVLTALFTVQELEISSVEDQTNLLLYRVALHRALGGTWTDDLKSPDSTPATTSTPSSVSVSNTQPKNNG